MAGTKWGGSVWYTAVDLDIGKDYMLRSGLGVTHFQVKGGAKRVIDLTSTQDISLMSEFEQIRSFKNVILYMPAGKNFEWLDFIEIAEHNLTVSIKFVVIGEIGTTLTQSFQLVCKNAKITELPNKSKTSDSGQQLLTVKLSIPDAELDYGSYQDGEYFEEKL